MNNLDINTIITTTQLSNIAYYENEQAETWAAKIGCTQFRFFEISATDTQAITAQYGDHHIIAFRGTSSLQNFMTDADCEFHPVLLAGKEINLHRGFYLSTLSIIHPIINHILDIQPKSIIITGHSLGAARTLIAAFMLSNLPRISPLLQHVITYGSPMVTDTSGSFIKWPFSVTAIEIEGDPVPDMPPRGMNYRHLQQRQVITLPDRGILTPDHPSAGYIDGVREFLF